MSTPTPDVSLREKDAFDDLRSAATTLIAMYAEMQTLIDAGKVNTADAPDEWVGYWQALERFKKAVADPDYVLLALSRVERAEAALVAHQLGWTYHNDNGSWYGEELWVGGKREFVCLDENIVAHVASLTRVDASKPALVCEKCGIYIAGRNPVVQASKRIPGLCVECAMQIPQAPATPQPEESTRE